MADVKDMDSERARRNDDLVREAERSGELAGIQAEGMQMLYRVFELALQATEKEYRHAREEQFRIAAAIAVEWHRVHHDYKR